MVRSALPVALVLVSVLACLTLSSPAAHAQEVVFQVKCAGPGVYTEYGTWVDSSAESNLPGACGLGSRSTTDPGAYAEIVPPVPVAGVYDVSVCWGTFTKSGGSNKGPNAENVEYTIVDANGNLSTYRNQRGQQGCANRNSDIWQPIGSGYFTPGGGGLIRITNTADGQCFNGPNKRYVNMDAVRLMYASPTPVQPISWGAVKARYE